MKEKTTAHVSQKSVILKGLISVVSVLLVLTYFIYNFFITSKHTNEITTQTAVLQTIYKSVTADMYFIRDEHLLSGSSEVNIIPAVEDGEKVAGGDTVAYLLNSAQDAQLVARKAVLEDEIKYYQSIGSASSSSLIADVNQDEKKISDGLEAVLDNICSGDISALYDNSKTLREHITKKQIDTGAAIDVSVKLENLRAEYDAITSSTTGRTALETDSSGYFFSFSDGFEGKADYENVLQTTGEDVEAYIASQPTAASSSVYGRIITQFAWYAVCNVKQEDISTLSVGSNVTVCFPYTTVDDIIMSVAAINKAEGTNTALVLRSTQMSEDIAALRKEKAVIRVESYSGYRVENSAIRFVDGEQGVYVLYGNIINFKKITTVYQDENIALAYNTDSISKHLRLYDEIITEGTDLYDGKIID